MITTKKQKLFTSSVPSVELVQYIAKKRLKCSVSNCRNVVVAVGYYKREGMENHFLNALMKEKIPKMPWNKQPHICRQRCQNIPGATRGVGSLGYAGIRKRCVSCEMYFPAKKGLHDKELCPCCGRQLRNKAKRPSKQSQWRHVGT